ncbi:UNVERIFIED_CONTAM: hypothetical protein GTU68_012355 [Idotea baltica]|nr:hypothetical protein [Idotea baltica]
MNEEIILEIKELTKYYRSYWTFSRLPAVNDVSLKVSKGSVYGFLGRNGAGKTTTIKCILGLIHKNSGSVLFDSEELISADQRSRIGYLPEQPYFYEHLSVLETLRFFAGLFGYSPKETKRRVERALHLVNLESRSKQRVRTLSKGLQQRLGVGQAILNSPELLILDEPFSGLDPVGRREMRDLFELLKQEGSTLFMSSHILSDIENLCTDIAIMESGTVKTTLDLSDRSLLNSDRSILRLNLEECSEEIKVKLLALSEDVQQRSNGDTILRIDGEEAAQGALSLCSQAAIRVSEFRRDSKTLEEVFLSHTNSTS